MHSVSFFKGPFNTVRVKRSVEKQSKWGSFQHIMSQSMLQPSVKMCHTWNIHFPLFASEQDLSVYPASLPWARFGKCISGCGVPVHRRHPSPLSGGPLWQTRAAPCSPITKLVIQPTHHQKTPRHLFYMVLCWKDLTTLLWQCPLDFPFGVDNCVTQLKLFTF